ncbi:MAG TPA: Trm112 family protein [Gemmatimonas sp.]|uniref:Trm112 family protein n=1 Tax=Gemmatimonas sp. TaxID=1962908 RepID=UPI002ED8AF7D
MSLSPALLEILVCPKSKAPLEYHVGPPEVLVCRESQLVYRVEDGVPVMLIEEAEPLDETRYPRKG